MNSIETSHDPAEQVAIARQQGATAREPTLPPEPDAPSHRRPAWLSGANVAIGIAIGSLLVLGARLVRRRR